MASLIKRTAQKRKNKEKPKNKNRVASKRILKIGQYLPKL